MTARRAPRGAVALGLVLCWVALAPDKAAIAMPAATPAQSGASATVTPQGGIGPLQLDRSTDADVVAALGAPPTTVDRPGERGFPASRLFEYPCGPRCVSIYFINLRNHLLTDFFTTWSHVSTPAGTHPGSTLADALKAEHGPLTRGCFDAIYEPAGPFLLTIDVKVRYHHQRVRSGRVTDLAVSSLTDSVLPRVC